MGIKPLYFNLRGGELYFGSELKTIFAHPEFKRELDFTGLHYYLSLNYVPCPHTLVRGVEKLPPGHLLEWQDGDVEIEAYWRLRFEPQQQKSLQGAQEELDSLLRESVRDHLISDVPLGIWLSGGVDSSTILHYTRELCGTRVKTFSVSFAGRSFDETSYIREIAGKYDTEHHEVDVSPSLDLPAAIEELAYYSDEPFADAGAVPVWFLSKLSRQRVTVALSGEGADEMFGGYITYRADHLAGYARLLPKAARRSLLGALRYWPVSDEKIGLEYKVKRFLEGSLLSPDEAHVYWNGSFSRSQQMELLLRTNRTRVQDLFEPDLPESNRDG